MTTYIKVHRKCSALYYLQLFYYLCRYIQTRIHKISKCYFWKIKSKSCDADKMNKSSIVRQNILSRDKFSCITDQEKIFIKQSRALK